MHDRAAALRTVALWLAIGVLGGAVFVWRMRAVDPDRTVRWRAESEVAAQARALLRRYGFTPPRDSARVQLTRDPIFLDSLQRRLGRPALIAALEGPDRARLPAYSWSVQWVPPGEGSVVPGGATSVMAAVRLDDAGGLLGLRVATVHPESLRHDARALAVLGGRPAEALTATPPPPRRTGRMGAPPDSATFRLRRIPALSDAEAGALARHHLNETPLGALGFVVDSVQAALRPGLDAARVMMHSTAPDVPTRYAAVEVASTGSLLGLTVRNAPDRSTFSRISLDSVVGTMRAAFAFLVLIGIAVGFVRRLARRQVDVKGSLRDALFTALLGGLFMLITSAQGILATVPSTGMAVFIIALNAVLVGAAAGFAGMAAAGVATSLGQSRWPGKLHALALLRRGALHDGRVGRALMRGTCAALAALGLVALALETLPAVPIHVSEGETVFLHEMVLSPIGFSVSWPLLFGYVAVLAVLVPALAIGGAALWRRVVVFTGAVLLLGLLDALFTDLPLAPHLAFGVSLAGLMLWLLVRYDILTALTAVFVVGLLWVSREGWVTQASPSYADSMIAFAIVGVLLLIGGAGSVASIETATDEALVPEYLVEHAREARILRELEIARTVQRHFLPAQMPAMPGAEIAATCVPASEVGGDLYDFVVLSPTRIALAIGDVSGKGIQAAFVMTLVKGFLQTLARDPSLSPCDVLSRLNGLFRANVPRGAFITMIYGVLDTEAGTFTYARAGHCPLLRCRRDAEPQLLRPAGAAIGLARDDLFHTSLHEQTLRLHPGDTLVLYTDGFSEARDTRSDLYGDDRLLEAAGRTRPPSSSALIDALLADVQHFAGGAEQHDDMTMMVVRVR
jgi:phosphoserine phosphatase RsbU/P